MPLVPFHQRINLRRAYGPVPGQQVALENRNGSNIALTKAAKRRGYFALPVRVYAAFRRDLGVAFGQVSGKNASTRYRSEGVNGCQDAQFIQSTKYAEMKQGGAIAAP